MHSPSALHTLWLIRIYQANPSQLCYQDTWSCVSRQESRVAHKYVIFTGTTNLPFSTPCISITTGLISIKFTYFIFSIYTPYIPNLKEITLEVCKICVSENFPLFFTFFFFYTPFYKTKFEPTRNTLLVNGFLSNLAHL